MNILFTGYDNWPLVIIGSLAVSGCGHKRESLCIGSSDFMWAYTASWYDINSVMNIHEQIETWLKIFTTLFFDLSLRDYPQF